MPSLAGQASAALGFCVRQAHPFLVCLLFLELSSHLPNREGNGLQRNPGTTVSSHTHVEDQESPVVQMAAWCVQRETKPWWHQLVLCQASEKAAVEKGGRLCSAPPAPACTGAPRSPIRPPLHNPGSQEVSAPAGISLSSHRSLPVPCPWFSFQNLLTFSTDQYLY